MVDGRSWAWVPYPVGHRKRESFIHNYQSMLAAREASKLHRYAPSVQAALDDDHFKALRKERTVLTFDTRNHPILEAFIRVIDTGSLTSGGGGGGGGGVDVGCGAPPGDGHADLDLDLSKLHERWAPFDRGSSHLRDKARLLAPLATPSPARAAFAETYDRLFLDVVAPAVSAAMPGETRLLYAAFPCVRIQQPCDFHTIRCHVDSMYGHPSGSVNCWLPLTATFGANALQLESAPGAEDFAPLEMRYGQVALFDGTACAHYTLANTTHHTRVSLDFRVVPGTAFDPEAECSRVKGGAQRYNLGGYYSEARFVATREQPDVEEGGEGDGVGDDDGDGDGDGVGDGDGDGDGDGVAAGKCEGVGGGGGGEGGGGGRWVRSVAGRPNIRHGFPHTNAELEP